MARKRIWLWLAAVLIVACVGFIFFVIFRSVESKKPATDAAIFVSTNPPAYTIEPIVDGLDHPWDVAFLPGGQLIYTERKGKISTLKNGVTV